MHLEASVLTYNELSVLLLEALVPLTELIGHQLVLVPLLLACVQLFGQNQESLLLTLQLLLADNKLCGEKTKTNGTTTSERYRCAGAVSHEDRQHSHPATRINNIYHQLIVLINWLV